MAEGGSSKQTAANLSGFQAGTVNIFVSQAPGEETERQETKDSQSGNQENQGGPRLQSDGCAVFENPDGTFDRHDPKTKQSTTAYSNENLQTSVTRQVGAMKLSTESAGPLDHFISSRKEKMRKLEDDLKTSFQENIFENTTKILEELRKLREADNLEVILQLAEYELMASTTDEEYSTIEKIYEHISEQCRSAADVKARAQDLYEKENLVQAMILYKISHDLHKKEKTLSPDDDLVWITNRVTNIRCAIEPLVKAGGKSRQIAINYGIKFMEEMLIDMRAVKNASPHARALTELTSLLTIASINIAVGENEKVTRFGDQGVRIMEQQFGEKASSYKHYAVLLNNLGTAYTNLGQYAKAENYFNAAIDAYMKASDYENEEEKQEAIATSKLGLEINRNACRQTKVNRGRV